MRTGVRSGRQNFVLFAQQTDSSAQPERVGFVVSKAVGNAVTRNLVKRRLRHLMAATLAERDQAGTQPRCDFVLRAFPSAAQASYAELAQDVASSVASVTKKLRLTTGHVQS